MKKQLIRKGGFFLSNSANQMISSDSKDVESRHVQLGSMKKVIILNWF